MDTAAIKIDREKARELYRAYLTHQHYEQPIDEEIRRTYRLIAQGRMIIQALESVRLAGVGDDGFPKLAIARADQTSQFGVVRSDGSATMTRRDAGAGGAMTPGCRSIGRPVHSLAAPANAVGRARRSCRLSRCRSGPNARSRTTTSSGRPSGRAPCRMIRSSCAGLARAISGSCSASGT